MGGLVDALFDLMHTLIDLSAFELEYQYRAKSNPFSEKWIHCTRTRLRTGRLKKFLYENSRLILLTSLGPEYYTIALKGYMHLPYRDVIINIKESKKKGEMDYLYRLIFYRLTLDKLFIILTNVLTWEHCQYPNILEKIVRDYRKALLQKTQRKISYKEILERYRDLFNYYLRFLDLLSSSEIVSLFDLDALRNTIDRDYKRFSKLLLEELSLFREWPTINPKSIEERFPDFLNEKEELSSPHLMA